MSDNYRGIDEDGVYKSRRSTRSTSSRAGQYAEGSQQRGTNGQRTGNSQQRGANGQRTGNSQQRGANGQRTGNSQQRGANGQRTGNSQQRGANGQRTGNSQQRGANGQRTGNSQQRGANGQRTGNSQQRGANGQRTGNSQQRGANGQRTGNSQQRGANGQRAGNSQQRGTNGQRAGSGYDISSAYGNYSGGYSRYNNTQSVNANAFDSGETLPKTNPPANRQQHSEHRSAVGRYTDGSENSTRAISDKGGSQGSFTVNISEDDYYDSDTTMQEISVAKSSAPTVRRRSSSASQSALVPMDANAATARRVVTGSMGDTYQIQDDGIIAPRQLRSKQKSVRKRNRGCVVALVYSAAVCSISVLLAYYMIVGVNDMFALVKDSTEIVIDVPKGATLDDVTDILDENGVVDYPFFFKTYANFSKRNTGFKAGTFTLDTKSDYKQLLTKLRLPAGADKSTITVTIPEGLTVEQVAAIMEENSVCEAENFIKSAKEVEFTQKFLSNVDTKNKNRIYSVEGYLYPDTYNFYLSEGSVNAINRLLNEYDKHWTSEYAEKAKEIGMSMDQVVILASIVEREASKSEDRYNVASVFINRLNNSKGTGGKLQSDATRWYPYATKKELLASDKLTQAEKDDWINNNTGVCDTYRIKGLPPGPICTPSLNSIEAVLYHENTGYYYFCSDAKGKFYFAKTLNEHNANLKKAGLA